MEHAFDSVWKCLMIYWYTYLHPFFQSWMETENLHAWLGVWIISWLEFDLCDAKLPEEFSNNTNQITQR